MAHEDVRPLLPGDELQLDLEIEHEMNIDEVRLVLVHEENARARFVLVDNQPIPRDERRTIHSKIVKRSEVNFRETITGDWTPGHYLCESVEFLTSGGRLITLPEDRSLIAGFGYLIGEEPGSTPVITNILPA